jgi:hypothetical protein
MEVLVGATDRGIRLKSRAAPSTLVAFEIFAVPIFSLFLYAGIVRHAGWEGATLSGAVCIIIFLWWRGFSLEVDESELRYRSFPWTQKAIGLRQITSAVARVDFFSQDNRPPSRLEIRATVDGTDVSFDINVKPFPLADVQKLEQLLDVGRAS